MTLLEDLQWRGLLADCTELEALTRRLAGGPLTLYCGFDPTADSLHVGNLVPPLALRRFQLAGHQPIAVAGGATGMIGDPSGKSDERNLQTPGQVAHNIAAQKAQLAKFLDFEVKANPARLLNNAATAVAQLDVGTSGTSVIVSLTSFVSGQPCSVTSATITLPEGDTF